MQRYRQNNDKEIFTHNTKENIMGFTDWLGLAKKKNESVDVK